MRRRCWPVLLALWPYAGLILADLHAQHRAFPAVPWQVFAVVLILLCAANVICALRERERPAASGMTAKLMLIPFYMISFFLSVILFAAPPALLGILLLDGLLLLTTSAYTLRGVYLAWRAEKLSAVWAAILAVSQCIFVLDVPGSIALYIFEKRQSQSSVVVKQ